MLGEPDLGWTKVTVGTFEGYASYLTDVPFDVLNGFVDGLSGNRPVAVAFDQEGSDFLLLTFWNATYVILNDEEGESHLYSFDISWKELAREVVHDMQAHFSGWLDWESSGTIPYDRRFKLKSLMERLRSLLQERA